MGGRLPFGLATASATVPCWVLPELDAIAAREGHPSRSQYLAALIMEAVSQDRARRSAALPDAPGPGQQPTPEGDGA